MIICFDLDGTLIDAERWVKESLKTALDKNNIKIPEKYIHAGWGLKLHDLLRKVKPNLSETKIDKICKDFDIARKKNISKAKPFKNTKTTLKSLSKKYKLVLLSNNSHKMINFILRNTGINRRLFRLIIGSDEVKKPKPFPNEIKKAERELKDKALILVGDSKPDIKTAKSAKIKSIIILNGPRATWKNLKGADYKIRNIKEVIPITKEVDKCHNI